jgi:hypothetical protein
VSWILWSLEIPLLLAAMPVNGAGALPSVVSSVNLDTLFFASIVRRCGNLPSTSQAVLIMAVFSVFIIPMGTLVAGEGLAILVLERRRGTSPHEANWQEVEFGAT